MTRKTTTNDNIRDLLDNLRLELKGDIKGVSDDVKSLSKTVANNEVKQAVSSTKLGMLITGITIAMSTLTSLVVNRISGGN